MAVEGAEAMAPEQVEETRLTGPFQPGPGKLPPYLAGRESEQALFRAWGGAVAQGNPPPSSVILYGPRGNGKTALLLWLQRHLAATPGVDGVRLNPSDLRTPAQLAEQLLPGHWWDGLAPKELSLVGFTWRPGRDRPAPTAEEVIRLRASKRPLALLLDEAHTLAPEVGNELLNVSQQLGEESPFLLVLAGTPDLRDRLSRMEASFWSRAEIIRINRLPEESAVAAIQRPLKEDGITVSAPALECVVRRSHGYPFFLQLWGRLLWEEVAPEQRTSITMAEVEAATPKFEERRGDYYADRYEELADRDLLPVARAIADAFVGVSSLPYPEVEAVIRDALDRSGGGADTAGAMTAMRHLGFVWRSGPTPALEPGIPSLMDYIREYAPAP